MNENRAKLAPCEAAGNATAEAGLVILDGPDGVAVTMTAEAAEQTANSLHAAAAEARKEQPPRPLRNDEANE